MIGGGDCPLRVQFASLIDHAIVITGEIDMVLDGEPVHLEADDVLVQRGTIHNWVNKGTAPCIIAFVLIAASRALPPDAETASLDGLVGFPPFV